MSASENDRLSEKEKKLHYWRRALALILMLFCVCALIGFVRGFGWSQVLLDGVWVGEESPTAPEGRSFIRVTFDQITGYNQQCEFKTERVTVPPMEETGIAPNTAPFEQSPINIYSARIIDFDDHSVRTEVRMLHRWFREADGKQTDVMRPKHATPEVWVWNKTSAHEMSIERPFGGKKVVYVLRR